MTEAVPKNRLGGRLSLALWFVATALIAVYTVGVIFNHSIERSGWIVEALESYPFALGAAAIGALVARRRPANPVGWMLLLFALVLSASVGAEQYAVRGLLVASPHWPGAGVAAWFQQWATFLFFPYPLAFMFLLFPDGRIPSRRFRPVVWFMAAFWVLSILSAMLLQGPVLSGCCSHRLLPQSPVSIPGAGAVQAIGFLGVIVALPFAVAGLVMKGRAGGEEVRHRSVGWPTGPASRPWPSPPRWWLA
jgi:hypothetical protein